MTSPSQLYQKHIQDTLNSAKVPNEIVLGRYRLDDSGRDAVEQPGWRRLTQEQFWQLVHKLATCTNVTRFEFSGNTVGPKAFAVLTQVLGLQKGLTHIDLRECDIRDIGCQNLATALEAHSVIRFLGLSRNRIRRVGAKKLARALKKCTTLQHIDVSNNPFGSRGLLCIQQPLRGQSNLLHVDFSNCGFDDLAFFWMSDALASSTSLRYISFSDNGLGPNEVEVFARALKRQASLECLILSGNEFGATGCAKIFPSIKGHRALQHVDVSGNMVADKGLSSICNSLCSHSRLRHLDLSGNKITSIGCPVLMLNLHHWLQLSHLDVANNLIDRRSVANIAETFAHHLPSLEFVDLSNNKIHGEGLSAISQALATRPKLKHVDLRGNDINFSVCFSVCENLKSTKNLESLFLDNDCELMPICVASKPFLSKFSVPPPELLACKAWAELVRFLQSPSGAWKAAPAKGAVEVSPDCDAAFDSDDVHGEDDESDADSIVEGSSCERSSDDEGSSSSSSDDDDDDVWQDAASDDGSIDSGEDVEVGAVVGSKRKLVSVQPSASATVGANVVAKVISEARKKVVASMPANDAVAKPVGNDAVAKPVANDAVAKPAANYTMAKPVAKPVAVVAAAAPGLDPASPADVEVPKRLTKAAIADIVIQSDLVRLPAEFVKQMCTDAGLPSAGNKTANIKRLQARFLLKYTKLFTE